MISCLISYGSVPPELSWEAQLCCGEVRAQRQTSDQESYVITQHWGRGREAGGPEIPVLASESLWAAGIFEDIYAAAATDICPCKNCPSLSIFSK